MILLKLLLIVVYVVFVILNYSFFRNHKSKRLLTILTVLLSSFMLFSSNTADLDWSEVELDMSGYRTIYEDYNVIEDVDFPMYPIFYSSMFLGQQLGVGFRIWWAVMSIFAMAVIICSCKVHRYSLNLFLASFMAYYEMIFYSGFKFFYGFCFLLLAYGYLMRNNRKGNLLFTLFTCIAGGFHVMYYFFLLLLIKPRKRPKVFVSIVVAITIVLLVLIRMGTAESYLFFFFKALDNDHINMYTVSEVHLGFYIALFIHIVTVFVAFKVREFNLKKGMYPLTSNVFFYTVLLSMIYCPFYTISLTFMRIITAFSLVVLTASSGLLDYSKESRTYCTQMALIFVFSGYLVRILMDLNSFFDQSIVPYFDVI